MQIIFEEKRKKKKKRRESLNQRSQRIIVINQIARYESTGSSSFLQKKKTRVDERSFVRRGM